jgi:D-alanyl-D-alanine carboxypeptidase (penicillin-binding protein 5/6)
MPVRKANLPVIGGESLAGDGVVVPAGSPPLPAMEAASWLVADLDTGEVLGAQAAHRLRVPASVQKVLLALTVLPKLDPGTQVRATCEDRYGWGQSYDGSEVGIREGGIYTVEDLFLGSMIRSGNDAANALARVAGGDRGVPGTLADMNAEARRIGAWDTHAATPSGLDPYQLPDELDDDYQVTSAYDLALIFRAAFAHEDFRRYITTRTHRMPDQPQLGVSGRVISMKRSLACCPGFIYDFPDALGGKTGYTYFADYTFVGAREHDGRRLVAAVLGVHDARAYQHAGALMDWGFTLPRGVSVGHLVEPGEADAIIAAKAPSRAPLVVVSPGQRVPATIVALASAGVALLVALAATTFGLARRRRRRALAGAGPREPGP